MTRLEELRIGNYLIQPEELNGDNYCVVWEILNNKIITKSRTLTGIMYCGNIEPILLTEEWLLKFGFENYKEGFIATWDLTHHLVLIHVKNGFYPYLEEDPEMGHLNSQIVYLNKIEYAHQLQNLYFCLTREELTIKI